MSTLLDTLEALEKAATPGPWDAEGVYIWCTPTDGGSRYDLMKSFDPDTLRLAAAARNALPALLRVARALSALDALMDFGAPLDQEAMIFADQEAINAAMAEARAALAALEPPHA